MYRARRVLIAAALMVLTMMMAGQTFAQKAWGAELNKTSLKLKTEETYTLKIGGVSSKDVKWKSSNKAVAKVSKKGKITAKSKGSAVITATYEGQTYTCNVRVKLNRWDKLLKKYLKDEKTDRLMLVKYTGGTSCTFEMYKKKENADGLYWKKLFSCSGRVGKNGIDKQREGDKKTPTGEFKTGAAFGLNKNPGTKIKYTVLNEYLYWSAVPGTYNTMVDRRNTSAYNGEHLSDYKGFYDYALDIGYNTDCVYKKGSAIFLHCTVPGHNYTAGCVAIPTKYMKKVLRSITDKTMICIYKK